MSDPLGPSAGPGSPPARSEPEGRSVPRDPGDEADLPEPAPFRLSSRPRPPTATRPERAAAPDDWPRAPFWEGVGFRLAGILAIALLPLGLLAVVQSSGWLAAVNDQRVAVLTALTRQAAGLEAARIQEARGLVAGLARTLGPLLSDEATCDAALTDLASQEGVTLVAFVPLDGRMRCASGKASFDFGTEPDFATAIAARAPAVFVNQRGPVSGVAVVGVTHPVLDADGGYLGFANVSLALSGLGTGPQGISPGMSTPDLVTLGPRGEVLSVSGGLASADAILPADRSSASLADGPAAFTATGGDGVARHYAVVALLGADVSALGSVPVSDGVTVGGLRIALPLLTSLLMWAASLGVAGWAAHRLVTRPMQGLSRAIGDFAMGGRVDGDLGLDRAPAEVRGVEAAFVRMADKILRDEAGLEDGLRQREALLREVHHRTRNNLQLIASIINMQVRRTQSEEARSLMRSLQDRILSLATVHRELYQTVGVDRVRTDELLSDIARQAVAARGARLDLDLAPLGLGPDRAVPLALFLAEAATTVLAQGARTISVRLTIGPGATESGEAILAIVPGDRSPDRDATEAEGERDRPRDLGEQLLEAFAAQLGGRLSWSRGVLSVAFPVAETGSDRASAAAST